MKNKKLFAILTLVCFLFTLMPVAAFAEGGTSTGTSSNDVITITTTGQFIQFIQGDLDTNKDGYKGKKIVLETNLDFENATFIKTCNLFAGEFDGNSKTISNFSMPTPLFGSNIRTMGSVKNVTIENATLNNTAEAARLGIICRNLNGTMENVNVVNCTINSDNAKVGVTGGLAAMTQDTSVARNCTVSGLTVNAALGAYSDSKSNGSIGGAFGLLSGNENTVVENISVSNITVKTIAETPVASFSPINRGVDIETCTVDKEIAVAYVKSIDYYFNSLDDAITAANGLTGEVTIEIFGKAEYTDKSPSLTGSYDVINFVGRTDDAEICMTRNGYTGYMSGEGNDAIVNFKDLKLSKPNGNYANDAGFMNVYFTVYRVGAVTYTNCVFPNGACTQGCPVTYTNCEFANSNDGNYGLWVYANTTTTVENCKFTGARGVKMYGEDAAKTGNLVLSNSIFTESVTKKPAIVLTYGQSVTLNNNNYPVKGVFELDKDASDGTIVSSSDLESITCVSDDNPNGCGALVTSNGVTKIYLTLDNADAAAVVGDTVKDLMTGRTYIKKADSLVAIYTVTFNSNGGSEVVAQDVEDGSYATEPTAPTKSGYTFKGWFATADCTGSVYSFIDTAVTDDITLYAKWNKKSSSYSGSVSSTTVSIDAVDNATVKVSDKYATKGDTVTITVDAKDGYYPESVVVTDKNGNNVEVTRIAVDKWTFTMPSGKVTVDVDTAAYTTELILQIGNTNVVNNGTTVNNDVAPFIQDGRSMVPIRVIVEQLGGVAAWDEATRTVTLTIDGKVLTMVIDEVIPGFDTAATIVDGRTYVPIRYISEAIGANVQWIAATNQIVIVK